MGSFGFRAQSSSESSSEPDGRQGSHSSSQLSHRSGGFAWQRPGTSGTSGRGTSSGRFGRNAPQDTRWTNWAGNVTSRPTSVETPASPLILRRLLDRAVASQSTVRVVGAGHSFTPAAATNGMQVSLDLFDQIETVEPLEGTRGEALVTVGAGIRLHALNAALAERGLAMPNLGDIDQQSIAGALATGTHGTGARLTGLAAQVHGLRILLASGDVIEVSADKDPDIFHAARVSVGVLGIVIAVTLRCVPAFLLHAHETPLPLDDVLENLDRYVAENDHFEFYWFPGTKNTLAKFNNRVPEGTLATTEALSPAAAAAHSARFWFDDELLSNGLFQFTNSLSARLPQLTAPINAVSSRALSEREYIAPSHEVFVSPRRVRFVEMEYAVPRAAVGSVLREIMAVANRKDLAIQFPIEVRFAAADDVWLSTAYDRDSAYIAVHQYQHSPYQEYFDLAEQVFRAAGGRPHWGKMHSLGRDDFAQLYPRFADFVAVRDRLDPDGVFANFYTKQVFGVGR